jgi:hypothetical protein
MNLPMESSMIVKLLGTATVGSAMAVASAGLLQRFLSGLASIVILSIVSAFMLCVLLAGGFSMAYVCLVHYGLDPYAAGITVGIAAFFITIALVVATIAQIRQLRGLPHRSLDKYRSHWPDIANVADAFIDGFLNHKE